MVDNGSVSNINSCGETPTYVDISTEESTRKKDVKTNWFRRFCSGKRRKMMKILSKKSDSKDVKTLCLKLEGAKVELKEKEELIGELEKKRIAADKELEELTATLFEEANKMVEEANSRRAAAEEALVKSKDKVNELKAEVQMLQEIINTPPKQSEKNDTIQSLADNYESLLSPITESDLNIRLEEYKSWKISPTLSFSNSFMARVLDEDIAPCLNFNDSALGLKIRDAILANSISIEESPAGLFFCALMQETQNDVSFVLSIGGNEHEEFKIGKYAKNRIQAVIEFWTYCKEVVSKGETLIVSDEEFLKIVQFRKNMDSARLGYCLSP